jgi:succinate-semialdehyde dehydrogenase/glutarate-semialdehyde dehydrogenase
MPLDTAAAADKLGLKDPSLLRSQAYLGGEWADAASGETITVTNPASGEVVASVPKLARGEVTKALEAAQAAFKPWAAKTAKERGKILRAWCDAMLANQDDLARIMTAEQGKSLTESRGEIAYAASFLEWFAEEARRVYGDTIPPHASDRRIVVVKQPVGVTVAITPWNFPAAMITRKVGPALAAGCPMVVKPASQTPLSALALAVLAERVGLPKGLLSVVTGSAAEIADTFTGSDIVRKLSFTGSTEIGAKLMAACAGTIKRVSLELGGNAPFIVFDDADLDAAVVGLMQSKYRNSGQTCVCANRVFVQDGVYDAFAAKLVEAVKKLKVAPGAEPGAEQGPLIDMKAVAKVEEHIEDAVSHGGRVLTGGKRHALGRSFFEPTVIADVTPAMKVAREETFGPVAPLFRFKTDEEAIALANATEFGLAAYFYAKDVARVWRAAEGIESGMVGINTGLISTEVAPFGGVKQSGLGREGSKYGIDEYLDVKYLCFAV